ncbi:acyl-CoA thioesterase [Azospirillum sp. B4]|uniref:acyl-CoA thioesterase n=1 Tax=Azospirillum sp. B4 TaxID=95605 RepID=UPI0005C80CEA
MNDQPPAPDFSAPDFSKAPALRTFAMPADTNANGDIFGGWVLSQMDLAGAAKAVRRARGKVATVGIEAMKFYRPVAVGDELNCYTEILAVGRTSIRVRIDTWVRRGATGEAVQVTEGVFTYVAIGEDGRPRPVGAE